MIWLIPSAWTGTAGVLALLAAADLTDLTDGGDIDFSAALIERA